jgi:SWI/SNF-related matrix-associated actin-dependent regulator 1 of chromatin subfamily A
MSAYRLTGEAKLSGSIEFIETLLEADAKFLLFCHHKVVLDSYEEYLKKKKIGHIRIDG